MSENIQKALEYAVELNNQKEIIQEVNGKRFYNLEMGRLVELDGPAYADTLVVNTLTGLVEYLQSKFDETSKEEPESLLINIQNPEKVAVYSQLNVDRKRENLITAVASLDKFPYGHFLDSEKFIINLQSLFTRELDAEAVLKCASSIRIEGGGDLNDNGVSQVATVKQGAATVAKAEVPSPAELRPYRTFLEVEQPQSPFIFRINQRGDCALFEADGGMWRMFAMQSIKTYLETELSKSIEQGYLTIIA